MKRAYDVLSDANARKRYDVMGIDLGDEEVVAQIREAADAAVGIDGSAE